MSNPFFDIDDILNRQTHTDLVKNALEALKTPIIDDATADFVKNFGGPDTTDLIKQMGLGDHSAQMSNYMDTHRADIVNAIARSADINLTQVMPPSWVTAAFHPDWMEEVTHPYWTHKAFGGITGNYASEAIAALSKNLPSLDISAQVADWMDEYQVLPDSALDNLFGKMGFFNPKSLQAALTLADTIPGLKEKAAQFVKDHPDKVDELAEKVAGKPDSEEKSPSPRTGDLSKSQRLTFYKEAVNLLAQAAVTSFTSGNPTVIVSQVTLSVVMFVFAIVEIEMQIREDRKQDELGNDGAPDTM